MYGHYSTGHPAFLYIIGAMTTIVLIIAAIVLAFGEVDSSVRVSDWKYWYTSILTICVFGYLMYIQAFALATLYVITVAISWLVVLKVKYVQNS